MNPPDGSTGSNVIRCITRTMNREPRSIDIRKFGAFRFKLEFGSDERGADARGLNDGFHI